MTPDFLDYYNVELGHIRQMAAEFARAYPKVAGRLDLDASGKEVCPDPFVERLLEGFAYLAARTRLKLDSEFPRFTQALLETVFPEYLSPMPSMAVVQFAPDPTDRSLADGFSIPRGTRIRTKRGPEDAVSCTYTTAHDVVLRPIRMAKAHYLDRGVHSLGLPESRHPVAALHLVLEATAGLTFDNISLDEVTFYVRGADAVPSSVMEHLFAHGTGVWVRDASHRDKGWTELGTGSLQPVGLLPEEALLPTGARTFDGYRLLMEYFAFPQRFLFFRVKGLAGLKAAGSAIDMVFGLKQSEPTLGRHVSASLFELHATPVVNLFPKRTDRVDVDPARSEHHVVVDRTRPLDYEIFSVERILGYGETSGEEQPFEPFYRTRDRAGTSTSFFTVNRRQRTPTERERKHGSLTSYTGSEVYVSLVDAEAAPHSSGLAQIGVTALCTNRHLPIRLSQGGRSASFLVEVNGPVAGITCLSGPTPPQPSHAMGETAWRLVGQLSLNYLSLAESSSKEGAHALQQLLKLYLAPGDRSGQRQLEGILGASQRPVLRRVPVPGMIAFARGVEVSVLFDEDAFAGSGIFLLGMVLENFFARHVAMNSFSETVICSKQRGEILRWPARSGSRHLV